MLREYLNSADPVFTAAGDPRKYTSARARKVTSAAKLNSRLPVLLIIVVGIVSVLPVLVFGFPFFSHDGMAHAIFYNNFAEQFWSGEIYPRWLMNMNAGLGSPTFFYYPPTAYYLAAPFYLLSKFDPNGWYQLGFSASLAQIASGLCAYLWLRKIADRNASAIAASFYMLMPYHLAVDFYQRGALAELWTFVWMPLILYFTYKLSNGQKSAAVGLAVSYALLVTSHLPVTLIFSPLPICYALFLAERERKLSAFVQVSAAMLLGIGLSAVFLLPTLLMQDFVQMQAMFSGYFSYENWFFFSGITPLNSKKIYFWIVLQSTVLAFISFYLCRTNKSEAKFWLGVFIAGVFMMSQLSLPVWQAITPLQKIQFPWRFNAILCPALAAILALGVSSVTKPYFAANKKIKICALLVIIAGFPYLLNQARLVFPATLKNPSAVNDINQNIRLGTERAEGQNAWSIPYKEKNPQLTKSNLETLISNVSNSDGNFIPVKVVGGTAAVTVQEWKPRKIILRTVSETGASLDVSQFYFPGWRTRLDDQNEIAAQPSAAYGLMNVNVPSGDHRLMIYLEENTAEYGGRIISLVSLFIILMLSSAFIYRRFRKLND